MCDFKKYEPYRHQYKYVFTSFTANTIKLCEKPLLRAFRVGLEVVFTEYRLQTIHHFNTLIKTLKVH